MIGDDLVISLLVPYIDPVTRRQLIVKIEEVPFSSETNWGSVGREIFNWIKSDTPAPVLEGFIKAAVDQGYYLVPAGIHERLVELLNDMIGNMAIGVREARGLIDKLPTKS